MSASPSGPLSGSTPQNGTVKMIRRRKNDNPLVAPKRRPNPQIRAAPPPRLPPSKVTQKQKDVLEAVNARDEQQMLDLLKPIMLRADESASGFTDPKLKEGTYTDYEIWATKRELRAGYRYHLARLLSKKTVDPRDETEFERPVRLHRRDPRNKASGKIEEKIKLEPNGIENKELEEWKAKREEEREANLAQIAPDAITGQKKKKISSTKAAEVHGIQQTEGQKARSILRYEEAVPWHLEDFENKNTWVGNYEEAMSGVHALLSFENGQITFLPVEKWYKFTRKDQFKTMSIEEVEDSMKRKSKEPRWMMEHRKKEGEMKDLKEMSRMNKGLYVGKEAKEDGRRTGGKRHDEDVDEIDAEGADEFADDEEDALFEADEEETKTIQNRLKKDMLKANIFDLKEEKQYEAEERREQKEKEAERVLGKAMRKALKKREKRYVYNSDDSETYNPFSESSSSSDDSETERQKDAAAKAEQERKAKEKAASKPGLNQPLSGTSSKGTNTPSGRPKHSDPLKTKSKTLKRPGSPDISDLSGTDTSRKKPKNKHSAATGTSTPQPGSRPMSPAFSTATSAPNATNNSSQQQPRKSSIIKLKTDGSKTSQSLPKKRNYTTGAGSGSDGEGAGTAGSGQEMSDGGTTVKKRLKLNPPGAKSPNTGTPAGSRATSPKPSAPANAKGRANSAGAEPAPAQNNSFPTISEVRAALPQRGLKIQEITKIFGSRIGGKMKDFTALLREVGDYQKDYGVFVPKK